jgi:hypothetical protein
MILSAIYSFPTNFVCLEFRKHIDGVSMVIQMDQSFIICKFNDALTITISVLSEV